MKWLQILFMLGCVSCASQKITTGCVSESQVETVMTRLKPLIEKLTGTTPQPLLKQNACWKRIYELNGYRTVIYQDAVSGDIHGSASLPRKRIQPVEICLDRASQAVKDQAQTIVSRYRAIYSNLWMDEDAGPVKWLVCDGSESVAEKMGWATFAHELLHGVHLESCLFSPEENGFRCLNLDLDLPPRSVVALDVLPTRETHANKAFEQVQEIYLESDAQSAFTLFDELNAYTTTTQVYTSLLLKNGSPALVDRGQRSAVFLPLFMVYALKYLEVVRKDSLAKFQRNFGRGTANWENLEYYLHRAEKTYQAWQQALLSQGLPELEIERNLWAEYLHKRARLYLEN